MSRYGLEEKTIALALKNCSGFKSLTANTLGITVSALCMRIERSDALQTVVKEIEEARIDLAEEKLLQLIQEGNLGAIMFFLRYKGRSRGYVEETNIHSGTIEIVARNPHIAPKEVESVPIEVSLPEITPPKEAKPLVKAMKQWKRAQSKPDKHAGLRRLRRVGRNHKSLLDET